MVKQCFTFNEIGQPKIPLHSSEGQVELKVPILNNHELQNGNYTIEISFYVILFNPIKPEISEFKFNLTS